MPWRIFFHLFLLNSVILENSNILILLKNKGIFDLFIFMLYARVIPKITGLKTDQNSVPGQLLSYPLNVPKFLHWCTYRLHSL